MVTRIVGIVVLTIIFITCPGLAQADGRNNEVGSCLSSSQVWLLVVDQNQRVLANQCVGTPSSGSEALRLGGIRVGYSKGNLICTMNDSPESCPRRFTGQFWNYWHAPSGKQLVFSDLGAGNRTPPPGSIEAWCYNRPGTTRCTPPELSVIVDGEQLSPVEAPVDLPVTHNEPAPVTGSPVTLIVSAALFAAVLLGFLLYRKRTAAGQS